MNEDTRNKKEFWENLSKDHDRVLAERQMEELTEMFLRYPHYITEWRQNRNLEKQICEHYVGMDAIQVIQDDQVRRFDIQVRWKNGLYLNRTVSLDMLRDLPGFNEGIW